MIRIISELDRESPFQPHRNGEAIYTLTVEALDHGDKPYTATATVCTWACMRYKLACVYSNDLNSICTSAQSDKSISIQMKKR